jgi:hypothetical protein
MSVNILGGWIAAFLTLSIFSYLYKDNPFYKMAEHIFVGVSAAYWGTLAFWNQIVPNLFGRLWPAAEYSNLEGFNIFWYKIYHGLHFLSRSIFPISEDGLIIGIPGDQTQNLTYVFPFILGVFMLFRLIPSIGWLSRWSLAYVVGLAAGLRMYGYMNSNVLAQMYGTILPIEWLPELGFFGNLGHIFNTLVIIIGVLSGLFYFFFSVEHKGAFGTISRVGIYFLMVSFGASFGFAVMGRISLLIGRFNDLIEYAHSQYYFATLILLVVMVITLFVLSKKPDEANEA